MWREPLTKEDGAGNKQSRKFKPETRYANKVNLQYDPIKEMENRLKLKVTETHSQSQIIKEKEKRNYNEDEDGNGDDDGASIYEGGESEGEN